MAEDQKLACNRAPFETTNSCDRGNVDIYTFSDLPLCSIIDPILPNFGPPTVDFPVMPIQPPPCACINIDAAATGKVTDRDDVKFDVGFTADGDCCEGNYHQKFDIEVPCIPFEIEGGSKEHKVEINEIGCDSSASPTGTITLGITTESCTVKVEPVLKLNIPKPPRYQFSTKLNVETVCCLESAEGYFNLSSSGDPCEKHITAHLDLKIPKPTTYKFEKTFDLKTVDGLANAYGTFDITSSGSCCNKTIKTDFKLRIPKPKKYKFRNVINAAPTCRMTFSSSMSPYWSSGNAISRSMLGSMWVTIDPASDSSGEDIVTNHLDIKIPCIMFEVSGASSSHSIDIEMVDCDVSSLSGTVNLGLTFGSCCELKFDPKIKLQIPRQKNYKFEIDPVFSPTCDEEQFWKTEQSYQKIVDGCDVIYKATPTIKVPNVQNMKVKNDDKEVAMTGGLGGTGTLDMGISDGNCPDVPKMITPKLTLNLPCPLDMLKLRGDSESRTLTGDKMRISVKHDASMGFDDLGFDGLGGSGGAGKKGNCKSAWAIQLVTPKTYTGCIKILTGIKFNGKSFEPITGEICYKDGLCASVEADSPEIDIKTSKHVNKCCPDEDDETFDNGDAADGF